MPGTACSARSRTDTLVLSMAHGWTSLDWEVCSPQDLNDVDSSAFVLKADDLEAPLLHLAQYGQQFILVLAMLQNPVNRASVYGYPGEHMDYRLAALGALRSVLRERLLNASLEVCRANVSQRLQVLADAVIFGVLRGTDPTHLFPVPLAQPADDATRAEHPPPIPLPPVLSRTPSSVP